MFWNWILWCRVGDLQYLVTFQHCWVEHNQSSAVGRFLKASSYSRCCSFAPKQVLLKLCENQNANKHF